MDALVPLRGGVSAERSIGGVAGHRPGRAGPVDSPPLASTDTPTQGRPAPEDLESALEAHRRELTGYCYRMLGSGSEAEDAVQETFIRAWRRIDSFEGRSSLRSWLYRIAHNVCLDMVRSVQRRARPMELGPSSSADGDIGPTRSEEMWVRPIADDRVVPDDADPGDVAATRESIRLAFVTALQHLPPKQRSVLIFREVLRWQASEVAELLDTTVASVNSALQRARATLEDLPPTGAGPTVVDQAHEDLLARYVDAFERYDITALVELLHEDAIMSMPPWELWLEGPVQIGRWHLGKGAGCEGSRVLPIVANGVPGVASYKPADDGTLRPWSIQVIESRDGKITALNHFIYEDLFAEFGLPPALTPRRRPAPRLTSLAPSAPRASARRSNAPRSSPSNRPRRAADP